MSTNVPSSPLETATFGLSHDAFGRLVLIDSEGVRHIGVEPVRAFPISDPAHWISIVDPQGREIVCVRSIADLPKPTRQVLEQELSRREFLPVIQRIEHVATEAEPSEWVVETDRGPTRFLVDSADDVRRLGSDGAIIVDMQGVRYRITSLRAMDSVSRRILEHYF